MQDSTCTVGPYAYKDDQWVGYDNVESIKYKMEYIKKKGLGGALVWDTSTDDFKGNCGEGKYPILSAVNRYLAEEPGPTTEPKPTSPTPGSCDLRIKYNYNFELLIRLAFWKIY